MQALRAMLRGGADVCYDEGMAIPAFLREHADGVDLVIHVQPRASRATIDGIHGDVLKIRVTAPPVDSAANDAVVRLLADVLGCSRSQLELIRGQTARRKTIRITGMSPAEIAAKLPR